MYCLCVCALRGPRYCAAALMVGARARLPPRAPVTLARVYTPQDVVDRDLPIHAADGSGTPLASASASAGAGAGAGAGPRINVCVFGSAASNAVLYADGAISDDDPPLSDCDDEFF